MTMDNGVREMEFAVQEKSFAFAVRIVKLCKYLRNEKREFALADQLLRSGTSIGANAKESSFAQSKADFIAKLFISLKEAGETEYWLELLYESGYIDKERFDVLYSKNKELIRIITSIIKTTKNNNC